MVLLFFTVLEITHYRLKTIRWLLVVVFNYLLLALRCIPHPLPDSAGVRGPPPALPRAGYRPEAPHGQHWCLELHLTTTRWRRWVT